MQDLYKILGVSPTASDAQIKAAYKALAKIHHPDKNAGNVESEEMFKNISFAYQTLSEPWKRISYDFKQENLQNPSPPMSPPPTYSKAKANKRATKASSKLPIYVTLGFFFVMSCVGYFFYNFMNKIAAEDAYNEAFNLEQRRAYPEAYERYTEALEFDGEMVNAYYRRGLICSYFPNRRQNAIYNFKQAIKLKPLQKEHYLAIGKVYSALARNDLAYKYFDTCTRFAPKYDSAWIYKAHTLEYGQNDYLSALNAYEEATKLSPPSAVIHADYAACAMKSKSYDLSLTQWNQALALRSENAEWIYQRALVKFELNLVTAGCGDIRLAQSLGFRPADIKLPHCK